MLRRSLVVLLAAVFAVAVPTAAFATTPDPTPPATEPPPATEAPAQPGTTVADSDDGADSDTDWLPIVLIAGGVVLLLIVLAALFGRSKRPPRAAATPTSTAPSPQANLLSTAQWIHDQLSLELMAADPTGAQQRWATERSRLDDVAIGAQAQSSSGGDPNWQGLGQAVSSLAAALDTNVALRSQDQPDPDLIKESTDVVNRNRSVLQQWINAVRPTITR